MPIPISPRIEAVCPHCNSTSCYHCHECGADVWSEPHLEGCAGLKSVTIPICKACLGTGRTKGNKRCHPCQGTGRQGAYNDIGKPSTVNQTVQAKTDPVVSEQPQDDVSSLWD